MGKLIAIAVIVVALALYAINAVMGGVLPTGEKSATYGYAAYDTSEIASWVGAEPGAIRSVTITEDRCEVSAVGLNAEQVARLRAWLVAIGCRGATE